MAATGGLSAGLQTKGVTRREAEVLDALTERLTNAQIGARLFISVRTVETHVASLLVKLGAADRTALAGLGRAAASSWAAAIGLPAPLASLLRPGTFVGRGAELDRLRRSWTTAATGTRQVLLVAGEAGIGKTRLTAEFAAEVAVAGAIVLHGRCDETLGVPYDACAEALGPYLRAIPAPVLLAQTSGLGGELARLLPWLPAQVPGLPEPVEASPEATRNRLFEAVRQLVDSASAVAPVALIVDDLHWAAEPTLLMLRHLIRSSAPARLLVIGTYRDGEPGPILPGALADLRRDTDTLTELALPGLDADAIGRLVALAGGAELAEAGARLARTIHAGTAGNPFFAREVLRHLLDTGLDTGGTLDWDRVVVPAAVRDVVGQRVARLPEPTSRFLRVAAVLGAEFELPVAGEVAALSGDALLDAFEESTAARLILEVPGTERAAFAHALVRRTLLDQLSGPRRRHLHLGAARAIEARYPDRLTERAAQLAHHLTEAGADPARTVHYLTLAGKVAIAGVAFEDAATHLERGAALAEAVSEAQRGELFLALGTTLRSLGRLAEAITAWDRARLAFEAGGDPDAAARAAFEQGLDLVYTARSADTLRLYARTLDTLGDRPGPVRVRLLSRLGLAQAWSGDPAAGDASFAAATRAARDQDDAILAAQVDSDRANACHMQMRAAEAVAAAARAAPIVRAAGNSWGLCEASWPLAFDLVSLGRFAEAEAVFDECGPLAEQTGNGTLLVVQNRALGAVQFCRSGDPTALADAAHRDIATMTRFLGGRWTSHARTWIGIAEFLSGRWSDAARTLREAQSAADPDMWAGICQGAWLRHCAYAGDRDGALAGYHALRDELPRPGRPNSVGAWSLLFGLTEGLFVLGEREHPAAWYPLIVEAIEGTGALISPYAPGYLLERIAAIAAHATGDWGTAEDHYRTAIRQADELPHQFERLETRRFYAGMLVERAALGDHDAARTHLAEAIAGYTRLGMPRHRDLAADALADLVP